MDLLNCIQGNVFQGAVQKWRTANLLIQICRQMIQNPGKKQEHFERYEEHKQKLKEFISTFQDVRLEVPEDSPYRSFGKRKYMIELNRIANEQTKVVEILLEDLQEFFGKEDQKAMVTGFSNNTKRYVSLFEEVIQEMMPERTIEVEADDEIRHRLETTLDSQRNDNLRDTDPRTRQQNERLPIQATKKFSVFIVAGPGSKHKVLSIRELRAELIGSLVECKAIVVRASEVKPLIVMATYSCDACGCEIYKPVVSKEFNPPVNCESMLCKTNKLNGKLTFIASSSKFISFQSLKIQETSDQLIEGSIPRTFTAHLKGEICRQASPGDVVMLQGVLLPNPREGFRHAGEIIFDSFIEVFKVTREKKKYIDMAISEKTRQEIERIRHESLDDSLFSKLARSIAPELYGLENVKKALLLLMVGGITKQTTDHLKIRGEINIALIGDPGIAKSQLLKHIAYLSPRGVYTTGKGSSGVGLTAAIVKDPNTNEVSLEAGALVLADMGVCCIDEFDKMDEYDRTAIHEVMEQQTVSIAKAGITTSLNARASILAAANPLYGRYNRKETAHKNINLPAALLSRFDLIFILLDNADKARDISLAKHIGLVHQKRATPEKDVFESEFLRNYIAISKTYEPIITEDLFDELTRRYIDKRKEQADLNREGYNYTTTRTLLGLIRLCQARARLRFSDEVSKEDVQECLELIEESQSNIQVDSDLRPLKTDKKSAIFQIIKGICKYSDRGQADFALLEKRVLARGYTNEVFIETLKVYEDSGVLHQSGNTVMILQH